VHWRKGSVTELNLAKYTETPKYQGFILPKEKYYPRFYFVSLLNKIKENYIFGETEQLNNFRHKIIYFCSGK
jgi:hypothetical protein